MTEHTPGPWSVVPSTPQEGFDCFWIVPGHQSSLTRSVAVVHGYQSDAEAQANARLIAAAPELLNLVKYVVSVVKMDPGQRDPKGDVTPGSFLGKAQSVLAKIAGEQNG